MMAANFLARRVARPILLALFSVSLSCLPVSSTQAQQTKPAGDRVESIEYPGPAVAEASPIKQRRVGDEPEPYKVVLDSLSKESIEAESSGSQGPGIPLKIGLGREMDRLKTTEYTMGRLNWQDMAQGGKMAAISITSPQATGLRLGVLIESLPAAAILRFYSQKSDDAIEVSGADILKLIKLNVDAGDKTENARIYWSPLIAGEEVTVEIDLPTGTDPAAVSISIPRLSHMYKTLKAPGGGLAEEVGQSGSCEIDATCYSDWSNESKATAQMTYTRSSDGTSRLCSGTLLNDRASDFTPYFLSANHCISDQTTASTLITNWFYRSASCNSGTLNPSYRVLSSGATLLYQSADTDTSFMRLNSAPPAGVTFAGWAPAQTGVSVTGVHHPQGDLQKISFGSVQAYASCTFDAVKDVFYCANTLGGSLGIVFSTGIVEPGSSGSGLFMMNNGRHYLIGQLSASNLSCGSPNGMAYYGRFDVAYNAALQNWLNASPPIAVNGASVMQFSSRATVTPSNAVYGSFQIVNPTNLYIAVRGPSLGTLGVTPTPLARPRLSLYNQNGVMLTFSNQCLGNTPDNAAVVSFYLNVRKQALDPNDACLGFITSALPAGVYTFTVTSDASNPNGSGEVVFDTTPAGSSATLMQFGTRGTVTPAHAVYGGFMLANPTALFVAVRGPSLGTLGITPTPLARPLLTLYNQSGQPLAMNNQCGAAGGDNALVTAFYLTTRGQPLDPNDPCLGYVNTLLPAGYYTFSVASDPSVPNGSGEIVFDTTPLH